MKHAATGDCRRCTAPLQCVYDLSHIFQGLGFRYDAQKPYREFTNMVATQRKQPRSRSIARPRVEYVAAVRYPDGRRDLFHVRNADNLADAREMVLFEVGDVRSLLIAERH